MIDDSRIARAESRIVRLAQAILPLEKDMETLKAEVKVFSQFKSRIEGQLDLIKWLVLVVPTVAALANAVITWTMLHGR